MQWGGEARQIQKIPAVAAGAVLKPLGGNCAVLPKVYLKKQNQNRLYPFPTPLAMGKRYGCSAAYCKNSGVFAQYLQPQFSKFHSSM